MKRSEPLSSKIRPKTLTEFVGQRHLVGKGKPLKTAIKNGYVFSMVFWGPPGVGKTTLAGIYSNEIKAEFHNLSAVSAGKADVRKIVELSNESNKRTILFLDEIHRFNKAQQDFLLPYVEDGTIILIGATTENPSFEVIPPLLSRCKVFVLEELEEKEMLKIIDRAMKELTNNGAETLDNDAKAWIINMANGDARQAISMIENTYMLYKRITVDTLKNTLQSKHLRYDKQGEEHYNTISAFIKVGRALNIV